MDARFRAAKVAIRPLLPSCGSDRAAMRLESELARVVRSWAPIRRTIAALAGLLIARHGWERLGFARLRDYADERLGLSARSIYDLARSHRQLVRLPGIDRAFVRGEIGWTKARLLARVATPEEPDAEARWLAVARRSTTATLERYVRQVDVGAVEGGGAARPRFPHDDSPYENVVVRCGARAQAKWHHVRQLACRVAGHQVKPWECGEMIAAEVLSAMPLDAHALSTLPDAPASRDGCAERDPAPVRVQRHPPAAASDPFDASWAGPSSRWSFVRELPSDLARLLDDTESAGPFELDKRLKRAIAMRQRIDSRIAPLLTLVARERLYLLRGFTNLETYARERLGVSPRKIRALLRLHRIGAACPPLAEAYGDGELSWVQAHAIIPILSTPEGHRKAREWVRWAARVSVRRLRSDVDRALLLSDTNRESFAATAGLPGEALTSSPEDAESNKSTSPHGERQTRANPTVFEDTFVFFHGPSEVVRLFRAVLCTLRRRIEQRTGCLPTPGEAFEAMMDHALDTWNAYGDRHRARHKVFERDGWHCTAPGCSSFRNLQDHHIVFRSAGGSNAMDNRTTLCAWHHLRGVHGGIVKCAGKAPHRLRFELGGVAYGPGETISPARTGYASRCLPVEEVGLP